MKKFFDLEYSPKLNSSLLKAYCPYCLPPTSGGQAGNKEQDRQTNRALSYSREQNMLQRNIFPTLKNAWRNIPFLRCCTLIAARILFTQIANFPALFCALGSVSYSPNAKLCSSKCQNIYVVFTVQFNKSINTKIFTT